MPSFRLIAKEKRADGHCPRSKKSLDGRGVRAYTLKNVFLGAEKEKAMKKFGGAAALVAVLALGEVYFNEQGGGVSEPTKGVG
jgi:hypothetical protein